MVLEAEKPKIKALADSVSGEALCSPCILVWQKGEGLSDMPFNKALIPFIRLPSSLSYLLKTTLPNNITLGIEFEYMNSWVGGRGHK